MGKLVTKTASAMLFAAAIAAHIALAPAPAQAANHVRGDCVRMQIAEKSSHVLEDNPGVVRDIRAEAQRERETRLAYETPIAFAVAVILTVCCVWRARRYRREYDQSHVADAYWQWYARILGGDSAAEDFESHTMANASKGTVDHTPEFESTPKPTLETLLSDDVHPLIAGWALTGGKLAYSAIVATLARLATAGAVHIDTARVTKTDFATGDSMLNYSTDAASEWILVFHKEKYALVSDPLDRAVLDVFENFMRTVADTKSVYSTRTLDVEEGTTCLLLSDMTRMTGRHSEVYVRQMRSLLAATRSACHDRSLDDDQVTARQRNRLAYITIGYLCAMLSATALLLSDGSVFAIALFLPPFFVARYLLLTRAYLAPLSTEAVRLRAELGLMARWLTSTEARSATGAAEEAEISEVNLSTPEWQRLLVCGLTVGSDVEAAHLMQREAPSLTWQEDLHEVLKWCGAPARGVVAAFVKATRYAHRERTGLPRPTPHYR